MSLPNFVAGKRDWENWWRHPHTIPLSRTKAVLFKRALRQHGYLTPHFTKDEFASKADSCDCPRKGIPRRKEARTQRLCVHLERVRHAIGDCTIGVLSGGRTPCHNDCIDGASASRHMEWDAVDPTNSDGVSWAVWNAAFEHEFRHGGIGRGCASGNVQHVDLGPERSWCYPNR